MYISQWAHLSKWQYNIGAGDDIRIQADLSCQMTA